MTPGRATLIGLMNHYLAGLMDPFISLLEVHKLVYFLQMAGEPLRLRFVQGSYGPYAENLRHVLQAVEGYYITGYGDGGDAPHKPLSIVPGATAEAEQFLTSNPSTQTHFEQVTQLVDGYETPFGLELLATVHWVVAQQPTISEQGLVQRVHAWSNRKRMFSPRQIMLAYSTLQNKGWFAS
jgi:hypothetical protein